MYIPASFRVDDPARLTDFIQRHSFATFVTVEDGAPFASHLPMLFYPEAGSQGTLLSHMARANPQWRHFATGGEALAIFHGPHTYISPSWYATSPAVPTWNYAAVHASGVPLVITDHERIVRLLQETVAKYESDFEKPWPGDLPEDYREKMIQGIVAFEMPITRLEGKFKLSQNRPVVDVRGAIEGLSRLEDMESRAVARMMLAELAARER